MKFIKKFFRFFAAGGNDNQQQEPPSLPAKPSDGESGELTREQLAEILKWLSLY